MAVELIDSYSESNANATTNLYAGDDILVGQSFTNLSGNYNITSAKFDILKWGSPTGSIYAKLYAHTGTYGTSSKPTGSPLATSNAVDITTATGGLVEFTFSTGYTMTSGTYYVIVIESNVGNASNYLKVNIDTSNSDSGNWCRSANGTTWATIATYGTCYYVYGELAASPTHYLSTLGVGK